MDLTPFLVAGANKPGKQVSVDRWNLLLQTIASDAEAQRQSIQELKNSGNGADTQTLGVSVARYLASSRKPFVTDDLPAFVACRDAILAQTLGTFAGNRVMRIPAGRYYLSDRFDTKGLRVVGEHSAQPGGAATLIRCGKNKSGIRLTGGPNNSTSAVENLQIWGGNVSVNGSGTITSYAAGDSLAGNGVEIAIDFGSCVNVAASFFGESGFVANSDLGFGNCNSFHLERCQSAYNKGDGYTFAGDDANAGLTLLCSAIENGGSGILDITFLGNTHIQPHVRDCGLADHTGGNGPVGSCLHNGINYAVAWGKEAQASATVPGTDSAVWTPWPGYSNGDARPWSAGRTWRFARPYATSPDNEGNGRGTFLNPYAESGQAPLIVGRGWKVDGGVWQECGKDPNTEGVFLDFALQAIRAESFATFGEGSKFVALGEPGSQDVWLRRQASDSITYRLRDAAGGGMAFAVGSTDIFRVAPYVGNDYNPAGITLRTPVISDAAGDLNNGRKIVFGNAAPTTGTWRRGDIVFNMGGSDNFAWRCSTGGSPGTWQALSMAGGGTGGGAASYGPETLADGDFASVGAWQLYENAAVTGGQGQCGTSTAGGLLQDFATEAGATYQVTWASLKAGDVDPVINVGVPGNNNSLGTFPQPDGGGTFTASDVVTRITYIPQVSGTTTGAIDNLSVKKVL